jgi:hypothetical protein
MRVFLQKIIDIGLLATILIFPFSINIKLISPIDLDHPFLAINFSLADLFLGVIIGFWIIKIILFKEWKHLKLPPSFILAFLGIGFLSLLNAKSMIDWTKEFIQMIEYFFLYYILLINNLKTIKIFSIIGIIYCLFSIVLIFALIQYFNFTQDPYLVRGLFENRNILGLIYCIIVPLCFAEILYSNKIIIKVWMGLLVLLAIVTFLSISALFSTLISILVISAINNKKTFFRTVISITLIAISYFYLIPQNNTDSIKDFISIYEHGNIQDKYYRRLNLTSDYNKYNLILTNYKSNILQIQTNKLLNIELPETKNKELYSNLPVKRYIKNRYLEMQAMVNLLSENTLLGVGLGNFQRDIGSYYKSLIKINTAEPNQHNGYLLIGCTTGILGLTSVIWIFLSLISLNKHSFIKSKNNENKALHLGLLGSFIACAIENFFTYMFIASILVPFTLIIYLSLRHKNEEAIS